MENRISISDIQEKQQKSGKKLQAVSLTSERLIKLGLPSLYYRRVRGNVTEMYKHTHGKYTVVAEYIERGTVPRGRGHKFKLKKQ